MIVVRCAARAFLFQWMDEEMPYWTLWNICEFKKKKKWKQKK